MDLVLAFGYNYGFYYGYDPSYILVLIGVVITLIASAKMKSTFIRYSRVASVSGLTGAQVAQRILEANGIYDVTVKPVAGELTDHYDPRKKTVNLSAPIYSSTSVAALGVAAHECGHAIQDNLGYTPLRVRTTIVPVVNIASTLSWPMIILGVLMGSVGSPLIQLGILFFSFAVVFQLVTLPVEFNASDRALKQLVSTGIMDSREEASSRKVLKAAAMTYVAAAASSMLQLLRLVMLFGRRNNND